MLKKMVERFSLNVSKQSFSRHRLTLLIYLGGFLVCSFLLFFWVFPLQTLYQNTEARIASTKLLIEKYRSKLKEAGVLKKELEKRRREVESLKGKLYKGQDPLELATSLGRVAKSQQVKNSMLSVRSYQISSTRDYRLYREVEFRFVLDANIYGLYSLLKWLDESTALIVRQLNVRYVRRSKNESGLMVNLVLTVLMDRKG